jgi:hypothetical protein
MTTLGSVLNGHYSDPLTIRRLSVEFANTDYVKLPSFLAPGAWAALRSDAQDISEAGVARDFLMPGYFTRRKMRGIGGQIIRSSSPSLVSMYENREIRCFLDAITGAKVHSCRHENEFMVMNIFDRTGATHGWHFDDPAFALILILDAPHHSEGGWLEYIDHNLAPSQRTEIARHGGLPVYLSQPTIKRAIKRRHHKQGDAYILRADRCLHRVTPVTTASRRAVLNLAYEDRSDTQYGDSADILYDFPDARAA